MKGKTSPMRIDEITKIAINLIVAKEQLTTGKNLTTNDGLWHFIERTMPDVAKEAQRLWQEEQRLKKASGK